MHSEALLWRRNMHDSPHTVMIYDHEHFCKARSLCMTISLTNTLIYALYTYVYRLSCSRIVLLMLDPGFTGEHGDCRGPSALPSVPPIRGPTALPNP